MSKKRKRFRVALSFAGQRRDYVAELAVKLAATLGEAAVLYDKYHEAEFARRDLGLYLPDLYHQESDLNVVIVCNNYEQNDWCGLEWGAIFALLKERNDEGVMLCRFDNTLVKGIYSTAGFVELDSKGPSEAAAIILERLALNEGKEKTYYQSPKRQRLLDEAPISKNPKSISPMFDDVPFYFQDRESEQVSIRAFLSHPFRRLLRVFGASGNGKTAVVKRVLNELVSAAEPSIQPENIITMNAVESDSVSISSLASNLAESFQLGKSLGPRNADLTHHLLTILSELKRELIIVFIDEFELLVDNITHRMRPEAAALISMILRQVRSPLKVILTTVFEPNDLALIVPSLQARIVINPLHPAHGEALLREQDADGRAGLRDESSESLTLACTLLDGSPRELEYLYWYLNTHRSTTLKEVLEDEEILHHNAADFFIDKTFAWLDSETQNVAKALAIFGRPVRPDAVQYLLNSSSSESDLRSRLRQLYDMGFSHRQGDSFYLQTIQRRYVLQQMTNGNPSFKYPYSIGQRELYARAADYFLETRDRYKMGASDIFGELSTELDEFDLRCSAEDYDGAARLLLKIDVDGLMVRGRFGRLVELHKQLLGKLRDPAVRRNSLVRLGIGYYRLGDCSSAVNVLQMALSSCPAEDESTEGIIKLNLGNCHAALGRTHYAIRMYSEALELVASQPDDGSRATLLQCLGNRYADLGDYDVASSYYDEADEGYKALLSSNEVRSPELADVMEGRALLFVNIASLRIDQRQFREAVRAADEAHALGVKLESILVRSGSKYQMAAANLYLGSLALARNELFDARKLDVPQLNHQILALQGLIAFRQKEMDSSRRLFAQAIEHARSVIALNKSDYGAFDFISLSEYGLSVFEVSDHLSNSIAAYRSARAINRDSGVLSRIRNLFGALTLGVDFEGIVSFPFDQSD